MEKIVTKRVNLETVSKKQSYSEVSINLVGYFKKREDI